jgi:hypothetical protein
LNNTVKCDIITGVYQEAQQMLLNGGDAKGWLMIIYRLPSTPSTSRVTVWKKIKELGAYLLQQSVYILPNLPHLKESVHLLKEQIHHLGGESKIIEITSLGEEQEKEVVAGFNSSREEEYTEVVKACNELLREIEEESKTEDFHFADLEENEKHIQRVRELLESVTSRDYFGSSLHDKAALLMTECQQKFDEFIHEVYSRDGMSLEDKKLSQETGKKYKERKSLSKDEMVSKTQEILCNLYKGSLVVGGKKVGALPDTVLMECEYRDQRDEKSMEITITWSSTRVGKKL